MKLKLVGEIINAMFFLFDSIIDYLILDTVELLYSDYFCLLSNLINFGDIIQANPNFIY